MVRSAPLELTANLLSLERGADELLLLNSFAMKPLYVARGRGHVRNLISKIRPASALESLQSAFPGDADLIRLLRDHRILVDPSTDKERFTQADIRKAAETVRDTSRMTVYLLLTEACNLGCIYCLNGAGTYRTNDHEGMTPGIAFKSVEECLKTVSPGGHLEVAFFGGEPLLKWPLLKEVIDHCERVLAPKYADRKITYHVTTNLTFCPPDMLEVLKRHKVTVMCDIDGPPEIHDKCRPFRNGAPSHANTADTIRRLVDAGVSVALRATIISANHGHIPEIAAHHKELGAFNSAFVPASPINSDGEFLPDELLPDPDTVIAGLVKVYHGGIWDKKHLFPFNQYLTKLRPGARQVIACAAPSGTTPVIRVNGDVYLCIYLVGQEKYRFGTLDGARDYAPLDRMMLDLHVDNMEECRACAWRYACGGGCPITKLARLDGATPSPRAVEYSRKISCDFTQALLSELLWDVADDVRKGVLPGGGEEDASPPDLTRFC